MERVSRSGVSRSGVSKSGTRRIERRIRSPRKAREWIDRAAVEIAASPAEWKEIVDTIRSDFGQGPLTDEMLAPAAYQFVDSIVAGRPASYPVRKLEPVAGGGMNAVLKSRDLFAGREIAVRRHLPAESAVEVGARAKREALLRERLLTLRRHPVIPRFWASGSIDGEACDVFDFAPGVSLARYVARHGLTYGFLLDFAREGARGLRYLHSQGLIHGDVKPENFCVLARVRADLTRVVRVTLIDFDIVSSPDEQIAQYALGNALEGTLPYMPPENFGQWVPEEEDEARAMVYSKDVFALGMTLYRIVTGKFPKSFYTSINSLLEKKTRGDEVLLEFPDNIPPTLQVLIQAMCAGDWHQRPSLPTIVRTVQGLRDASSDDEIDAVIASANPDAPTPEQPSRGAVEQVGPYRVVNRAFGKRPPGDGQDLPIASLEDPFGRKLVGVPFAFSSKDAESEFYDDRCDLLKDLNAVRLKHADLLPGSFRDLVREQREDRHLVWIIRPLLEGAIDLTHFLEHERPAAPVGERIAILRRTAEALAVLEDAGYVLPRLTPELIFFVPQPDAGGSLTKGALTRPLRRLFDVPTSDSGRFFRQELMGTAGARHGAAPKPDPIVDDLLEIARTMKLLGDIRAEDRALLMQVRDAKTWRERVQILVFLEMQHTTKPPDSPRQSGRMKSIP